jgi:hypothetical protein
MQKRRWSELSPTAKVLLVLGSVIELVLTSIALRDLSRRPAAQVRGPKFAWGLMSFVQPVGPIAYLLLGRRREG